VIGCLILAVVLAASNLNTATAANTPQQSATLSFTLTTTSSYIVTTGGHLTVKFNSVQVDTSSPQAYAFGITATAAPGATITRLHWEFGDGTFLDVPYCCENQVSEVRYHAYQQPGTYTVLIIAYDSAGNFGDAFVTVSWPTPIPEFTAFIGPVLISIIMGLATVGFLKSRRIQFLVK
jgi:hypothetical protein